MSKNLCENVKRKAKEWLREDVFKYCDPSDPSYDPADACFVETKEGGEGDITLAFQMPYLKMEIEKWQNSFLNSKKQMTPEVIYIEFRDEDIFLHIVEMKKTFGEGVYCINRSNIKNKSKCGYITALAVKGMLGIPDIPEKNVFLHIVYQNNKVTIPKGPPGEKPDSTVYKECFVTKQTELVDGVMARINMVEGKAMNDGKYYRATIIPNCL